MYAREGLEIVTWTFRVIGSGVWGLGFGIQCSSLLKVRIFAACGS